MSPVQGIGSRVVQQAYEEGQRSAQLSPPSPESGFASRLRELVESVDRLQDQSSEMQSAALRGEEIAAHDVMIATEQASLAFTLMVEIRNKLVEAYQDLMRMQV